MHRHSMTRRVDALRSWNHSMMKMMCYSSHYYFSSHGSMTQSKQDWKDLDYFGDKGLRRFLLASACN
jgi:predicted membrane channel-forming protein YqfA (hemolysin III family)